MYLAPSQITNLSSLFPQTLHVLSGLAFGQMKQLQEQLPDPIPDEYTVRERSCPKEYVEALGRERGQMATM